MVKYEQVKNQSTEDYFKGNQFSVDAFKKKYALSENETYVQAIKRVCDYIASAEDTPEKKKYWAERWFDEIYNDWWHPAGSIMQGAASGRKISLMNCTTLSLGALREDEEWDNLESIIKNTAFSVAKCAAYRQGLGANFSRLRPAKSKVLNSANESTGSIHWMRFIDSIGQFVGQAGRVPAFLFSLSITHPDVEEFICVKSDRTVIQNANISVEVTDAFYKAVLGDKDWELFFEIPAVKKGDKVYIDVHSITKDCQYDAEKKKYYYIATKDRPAERITKIVKAKALLELIAKNMTEHAEPGIQNIDIARKYSNSDYVYDPNDEYDSRIIGTNACSEQYLSRDSLCVLASINAAKFAALLEEYEKELAIIAASVNRFLDNVNEMELRESTFATPFQAMSIRKLRRTGAGFTNVAGWLFKNNLEYATPEGNDAIAKFTERYNYYLYKNSIELGKEKGSFELFKREKYEKSPFIQRMMGLGLEFVAMRNCTCSSIAPVGTLSLMFRDLVLSYGIEPAFGMYFWKRTRISGHYEYYFNVPNVVREEFKRRGCEIPIKSDSIKDSWDGRHGLPIAKFIDEHAKKIGVKFKNATEVKPLDKLDLMAKVMKWIDSSISVTYMLPEGTKWKDIYEFILETHKREVKSITAFPDRKMYGIVSYVPFKDLAVKLKREGVEIPSINFTKKECDELVPLVGSVNAECGCVSKIHKTTAPKRPDRLPCEIHHVKITKKLDKIRTFDYLAMVGLLGHEPYEIFVTENGFMDKKIKEGWLVKKTKGVYSLESNEGETIIEDVTKETTEAEDVVTRLTSTSLRHGADISFVVDQLEKSEGDLFCFSKAISRVLKKYIKDGTKVANDNCPKCGGEYTRQEGCKICNNCGYSKCS